MVRVEDALVVFGAVTGGVVGTVADVGTVGAVLTVVGAVPVTGAAVVEVIVSTYGVL